MPAPGAMVTGVPMRAQVIIGCLDVTIAAAMWLVDGTQVTLRGMRRTVTIVSTIDTFSVRVITSITLLSLRPIMVPTIG